jgi:hypothetical protein
MQKETSYNLNGIWTITKTLNGNSYTINCTLTNHTRGKKMLLTLISALLQELWHYELLVEVPVTVIYCYTKRPGREADHSSPSSAEFKEWVELYIHSPNTPLWHGAQLKARGKLYLYICLFTILFCAECCNDRITENCFCHLLAICWITQVLFVKKKKKKLFIFLHNINWNYAGR